MLRTTGSHRRLIRPAWLRAAGLAFLFAAATLAGPEFARAQRGQRDNVDRLRDALDADNKLIDIDRFRLKKDDPLLTFREENLTRRAKALNTLGEMGRGLALTNWFLRPRVKGADAEIEPSAVEAIDEKVYADLSARFQAAVRDVLKVGRPGERVAAMNMIGDLSNAQRAQRSESNPLYFHRKVVRELAPVVIEQTRQTEMPELRAAAAMALASLQVNQDDTVKAFADMLSSPDPNVQRVAAEALSAYIQTAEKEFRKVTYVQMEGEETPPRYLLEAAVLSIPPAGQAVRSDRHPDVRRSGAEALKQITSLLRDAVQDKTRDKLEAPPGDRPWTPEDFRRVEEIRSKLGVAETLQTMTRVDKAFDGLDVVLISALTGSDPVLRLQALQVLDELAFALRNYKLMVDRVPTPPGELPPEVKDAPFQKLLRTTLPAVTRALTDQDVQHRRAALNILEFMGEDARPALSDLVRTFQDRDVYARWAAIRIIGALASRASLRASLSEGEIARLTQGMTQLLNDRDYNLQLAVLTALERIGPRAEPAVAVLWSTANRGDNDYRINVLHTLQSIGPVAVEGAGGAVVTPTGVSLPAFARSLSDPEPNVRKAAAEAFARFASFVKPEEKGTKLYRLLSDPNSDVRVALKRLLDDPNEEVRKAASEAILQVPR
jgi:HEAT repeat protein